MPQNYWTAEEVGERFFVPTHLVKWWVKSGQLPSTEGVYIAESDLEYLFEREQRWIEQGWRREDATELKEIVDRMNQRHKGQD